MHAERQAEATVAPDRKHRAALCACQQQEEPPGAAEVEGGVSLPCGAIMMNSQFLLCRSDTKMCPPCRLAAVALLGVLLTVLLPLRTNAAASRTPSASAAAATPSPLRRFKSWEEAWAALSPYGVTPKNGSAPCGSGPSAAAACGVSSGLAGGNCSGVQPSACPAHSCPQGARLVHTHASLAAGRSNSGPVD